jgi:hypothetical protein
MLIGKYNLLEEIKQTQSQDEASVTSRIYVLSRKYNDGNNYFLFAPNYVKLLPMD